MARTKRQRARTVNAVGDRAIEPGARGAGEIGHGHVDGELDSGHLCPAAAPLATAIDMLTCSPGYPSS
jgi:hypothetical protein